MADEVNPAPQPARRLSGTAALLGVLIAAAALLRFTGLARQSLWVDEVLSMRVANRILSLDPASELFNIHGPLYFYLLAPALAVDVSETAARLPSALLGVALVAVIFLLGRDLMDRRTGLAAAAVAASSPFALWYSQEVRYVSLYLFLASASAWTAWRFLQRGGAREGVWHVVATILMLLAFPAGIFVCLGENLWALAARPGASRLRSWILVQGIIALVFVPWLYGAYTTLKHPEGRPAAALSIEKASTGFARPLRPIQIGYPLFTFGVGLTVGPSNRELHRDLGLRPILEKRIEVFGAILITGALATIGSVILLRRSPSGGLLLLLLVLTSLLGPYVLAGFSRIAYNVRYTSGGFPAYLLLLGIGASWAMRTKPWGWLLLAGFAGLTLFSLTGYFSNPYYFRDDNRGAAAFVAGQIQPGEPLVVGSEERAFLHYFRGPITSWRRWRVDPGGAGEAESMGAGERRFWVAANREWEEPLFQEFLAAMRRCFPIDTEAELPGYHIYAFRAGGAPAASCSMSYQHSSGGAAPEAVAATP